MEGLFLFVCFERCMKLRFLFKSLKVSLVNVLLLKLTTNLLGQI